MESLAVVFCDTLIAHCHPPHCSSHTRVAAVFEQTWGWNRSESQSGSGCWWGVGGELVGVVSGSGQYFVPNSRVLFHPSLSFSIPFILVLICVCVCEEKSVKEREVVRDTRCQAHKQPAHRLTGRQAYTHRHTHTDRHTRRQTNRHQGVSHVHRATCVVSCVLTSRNERRTGICEFPRYLCSVKV